MKIRSKLAWTFIVLLIFGITSISSYSILFIRDYLLQEGRQQMEQDTRWLAVTVSNLSSGNDFDRHFKQAAQTSGYQLALYDSSGQLMSVKPKKHATLRPPEELGQGIIESLLARNNLPLLPRDDDADALISYIELKKGTAPIRYLRAAQLKDEIYAPIKTIRWIIYYGMFISVVLIIIVSIWISRYLTKPITQIKDAAKDIAKGDVNREINLNRKDEFGTLATSLNKMASELREDTRQIKKFADKQRQFFADITHEVRNPLHNISAALEMLELQELPADKEEKYIGTVQNQVERISRLFKDLKTLQRYDSDEYFVETREFDLATAAEHMLEWHSNKASQKEIELKVDTHSCKTIGDPGRIEQVIDNLVSNAIKYTNGGAVYLNYEKVDDEVRIQVRDNGIGISEEHLKRLFHRFYRTDKARSRDKGGTGLGLAVVKSILNAHDRDIQVESAEGEGTIFWFTLPAA